MTAIGAIFRTGAMIAAATLMTAGAAAAGVNACDRAASHPDDPDKVMPGKERAEIDLEAAEAACRAVLADAPDHARTNYHLGRVLFYQDRQAEGFPYLTVAADAGYRQSIFVLGYVEVAGFSPEPDACRGMALLQRGAALEHPWSGYHLVNASLDGVFDACEGAPDDKALARYMSLARDNITVGASDGRVEALYEMYQESLDAE